MPNFPWEAHFSTAQLLRWAEASATRFACRSFAGPPSIDQLSAMHYTAAKAELPGVRIAFGAREEQDLIGRLPFFPQFVNTHHFAALVVDRSVPSYQLHAGFAGEALCLEATHLGLGSCWVMSRIRKPATRVDLRAGERLLALIPFGLPQDPDGALKRRRKPLSALCLDDPAQWPNWAFQAAEAMRAAPSAINLQPWRFSHNGNTLRLSGRGFPSVDYGIAALHAECALAQQPHRWRLGQEGDCLLITLEDARDAV